MPGTTSIKIVVIYPHPTDEAEFERVYEGEHVPMVEDKLKGITRLVLTKEVTSPQEKVAAYRIADVHFSSLDDLNKAKQSERAKCLIGADRYARSSTPPAMHLYTGRAFWFW